MIVPYTFDVDEAYFLNVIGVQRPVVRVVRVSRNQNVLQPRLCADRDNDRRMVILRLVSRQLNKISRLDIIDGNLAAKGADALVACQEIIKILHSGP